MPGSIAMEMFLQDSGRPREEVALEYLAVYEGLPLNEKGGPVISRAVSGQTPPNTTLPFFRMKKECMYSHN